MLVATTSLDFGFGVSGEDAGVESVRFVRNEDGDSDGDSDGTWLI